MLKGGEGWKRFSHVLLEAESDEDRIKPLAVRRRMQINPRYVEKKIACNRVCGLINDQRPLWRIPIEEFVEMHSSVSGGLAREEHRVMPNSEMIRSSVLHNRREIQPNHRRDRQTGATPNRNVLSSRTGNDRHDRDRKCTDERNLPFHINPSLSSVWWERAE